MLKYDSDIVLKALDKARWELQHAKGDVRNTKATDFLNDCIEGIETWMGNAQLPVESSKQIKSSLDSETFIKFRDDLFDAIQGVYSKYNMYDAPGADKKDFDKVINWMDAHGFWDVDIESSRKSIKSDYNGLSEEVGDLQIDMTNTGYFEDGWLLIQGENEEGYRDGTEFTINAYGPNGEDLGSKKFDFLDLWNEGSVISSKKLVKSGLVDENEAFVNRVPGELHSYKVCYVKDNKDKVQYGFENKEEAIDWINKNGFKLVKSSKLIQSKKPVKSGYGDAVERLNNFTDKEVDYALNAESLAQFKERMNRIATKKGITFTNDELEFIYKGGGPVDPVRDDEEEGKQPRKYKKYNTPTSREKFEAENHWFDDSPLAVETYSIGYNE